MGAHVIIGLALIALVLAWAIWSAVLDTLRVRKFAREQAKRAAMRRHPSARPSSDWMSDAEREYHQSDRLGRN